VILVLLVVVVGLVVVALRSREGGRRAGVTVLVVGGLLAIAGFGIVGARGGSTPDEEPPRVSLVEPLDGTEVTSPVRVVVDVVRLGVHHVDVSADAGCGEGGGTVHLAGGVRETSFQLTPGEHRICTRAYDTGHHPVGAGQSVTVLVVG
jgi:hypothetical protein